MQPFPFSYQRRASGGLQTQTALRGEGGVQEQRPWRASNVKGKEKG